MKRLLTVVLLLAVCITGFAGGRADRSGRAVPKEKLLRLIADYRHSDGFDVVNIGGLGTSLARSVAKIAVRVDGDSDAAKLLRVADGIRRFCVVDYEDCAPRVRDSFNSKLSRILSRYELLVEVKDTDDNVRMYGVVNEDASKFQDFVIFVPNDCALVCLFGSIPMDAVGKIMEEIR